MITIDLHTNTDFVAVDFGGLHPRLKKQLVKRTTVVHIQLLSDLSAVEIYFDNGTIMTVRYNGFLISGEAATDNEDFYNKLVELLTQ